MLSSKEGLLLLYLVTGVLLELLYSLILETPCRHSRTQYNEVRSMVHILRKDSYTQSINVVGGYRQASLLPPFARFFILSSHPFTDTTAYSRILLFTGTSGLVARAH